MVVDTNGDKLSSFILVPEASHEFISLNIWSLNTLTHTHTQAVRDRASLPFDGVLKLALFNRACHVVQVLKIFFFLLFIELLVV